MRLSRYGWLFLWFGLLAAALLCRPPLPVDETRYLSVAWEMWQQHQFLVPHVNGQPYSHKPPLLFWMIQAGWKVFGVNVWSARLTAPLFGLFTILLTMRLARMLWPMRQGSTWLMPYLFLATLFWSFYATLTMFEMLVSLFALIAWMALWSWQRHSSLSTWFLFALATGFGFLSKGPVILVYILPPALLAPWWMEKGRCDSWSRWYARLTAALAAGIIIALIWVIPAAYAGGREYGRAILLGQTVGRMRHSFAHARPWYWYLLFMPLLLFPWSLCPRAWRAMQAITRVPQTRFCLCILGPGLVLFSIISGKQVHYLLPLIPPFLLLLFQNMTEMLPERRARIRLPAAAMLLFSLALFVTPHLSLHGGDSELLHLLPAWTGLIPLITGVVLLAGQATIQPVIPLAVTLNTMLIILHIAFAPVLSLMYDQSPTAARIQAAQQVGQQVAVYPASLADQFQFAGRLTKPLLPQMSLKAVTLWASEHRNSQVLLLIKHSQAAFFKCPGTGHNFAGRSLVFRPAAGMAADFSRWRESISTGSR